MYVGIFIQIVFKVLQKMNANYLATSDWQDITVNK